MNDEQRLRFNQQYVTFERKTLTEQPNWLVLLNFPILLIFYHFAAKGNHWSLNCFRLKLFHICKSPMTTEQQKKCMLASKSCHIQHKPVKYKKNCLFLLKYCADFANVKKQRYLLFCLLLDSPLMFFFSTEIYWWWRVVWWLCSGKTRTKKNYIFNWFFLLLGRNSICRLSRNIGFFVI